MTKDVRYQILNPKTAISRLTAAALVLAIGAFSLACDRSPLDNSFGSAESLAKAVLGALEHEDREAMLALMVTSEEHLDLLWEHLPESNHLPFDYARQLNEHNSGKAVTAAIANYGGNRFELVSIEFTGEPEEYDGFTLHFGAVLKVRRVSDRAEGALPILDVILEYGGRWKLMNYDE